MTKKKKILIAVWVFFLIICIANDFTDKNTDNASTEPEPSSIITFLVLTAMGYGLYWMLSRRRRNANDKKALEKAKQERFAQALEDINTKGLSPISNVKAILKEGEEAYSSLDAGLYELKSSGVKYNNTNVRIRIMKGVSVGLGGGKAKPEKELVMVSEGQFIITNQRVIFAGNQKSFEIKLANLTYFDNGADYITFHAGTRSHTLFMDVMAASISNVILNKLLR